MFKIGVRFNSEQKFQIRSSFLWERTVVGGAGGVTCPKFSDFMAVNPPTLGPKLNISGAVPLLRPAWDGDQPGMVLGLSPRRGIYGEQACYKGLKSQNQSSRVVVIEWCPGHF